MFKLKLFIIFKKYFIVINEHTKENKIDNKLMVEKISSWELRILLKPYKLTAPKVGIDNKKDILADSNLVNFKILAAVIAIPDLLTPGTKDNIWNRPINIADL